jgi:hypothetical protein
MASEALSSQLFNWFNPALRTLFGTPLRDASLIVNIRPASQAADDPLVVSDYMISFPMIDSMINEDKTRL